MTPRRVRIGQVPIDPVSFSDAISRIEELVGEGRGGNVFTPNVDHVVLAENDSEFREGYHQASLSLVDGMPLVWAARLLGTPLPEKVSGSDLLLPLANLAGRNRWPVYLLGGGPGVAAQVAAELEQRFGTPVVGFDSPRIDLAPCGEPASREAIDRIRAVQPRLIFVALGSPKQEVWIHRYLELLRPAVAVGVGASFDFIVGVQSRAPRWMSRLGMEWLYRLAMNPRRLWRRYLLNDPKFLAIFRRTWRQSRNIPRMPWLP